MVAASLPLESAWIRGLTVASAALGADGRILDANGRFLNLFGIDRTTTLSDCLADVVTEDCRPAIREALARLCSGCTGGQQSESAQSGTSCIVTRASRPPLRIRVDIRRQGRASAFAYLVYAAPAVERRGAPARHHAQRPCSGPEPPAAEHGTQVSSESDRESWPPLLRVLSHELRGSLNGIRGWIALAESGTIEAERVPRALSIIRRNVDSLATLVETLFDMSRTTAGCLSLRREALDLNQLVENVADISAPAARLRQVSLTLQRAGEPLPVYADRVRLEQIVRNLLDNAIKFTAPGGSIDIRTRSHQGRCELTVADTGVGIAPDLLAVIFDPVRRTSRPAPSSEGLGLGLALVRELVHLHHGEITALSEGAGRGSTFVVQLPLASASGAESAA